MEISKNGYTFYINRLQIETDKQLIQRSWFIVNQLNDINNEIYTEKFNELTRLSRIWHNIKNLKCKYPNEIMEAISCKEAIYFC